jgi:chromosomal replication initiation ATPase DnaA
MSGRREQVLAAARIAAAVYDIDPEEVLSRARFQSVVFARDLALWLIKRSTQWSAVEIGRAFGMDHTSVLVALRRASARIERDPGLLELVEARAT